MGRGCGMTCWRRLRDWNQAGVWQRLHETLLAELHEADTTAANVPDVNPMIPLVDAIPPVRGKPGRPRRRPASLYGDRGYDSDPHRRKLRRRGIRPYIARRRTPHGSGLGTYRWYVERTLSWLHNFGRLRVRKPGCPRRGNW